MKTTQERIFLLLMGVCVLQILYYAPHMPERMASHFNSAGDPNGWSTRTVFFVLYGAMLNILFLAFRVLPSLFPRFSDNIINLPNKAYWLAPERRAATFFLIKERMVFLGNGVLIFFIATFQLVLMANLTDTRRMNAEVIWLVLACLLMFTMAWTFTFIRLFRMPPAKK